MREASRKPANHLASIYSLNMDVASKKTPRLNAPDTIPDSLQKYILPGADPVIISGWFGHFVFQEFRASDGNHYIRYNHYMLEEEQTFNFYSEQAQLCLQFDVSNSFYLDMEGIGKWKAGQGTYNLFFVPYLDTRVTLKPGKIYTTLNIYFRCEDLMQLGPCSDLLDDFIVKVATEQPALLHAANQPITRAMERTINEILTSHSKGNLQPVFLENKIYDLLISCFDPKNVIHKGHHFDSGEEESERLYEAKKILLENIQDPLSLTALSKRTGLNIKKIKTGFKRLFHHSPYNLLLNARMEMAECLLSETNLPISDISDRVGYIGVQSFSKAFKLFFKESPLQYRKKLSLVR